jgi:hypothetical protein
MASGEDFESVVGAWLEELIAQVQPIQSFPLRLRRGQTLKGDSGNYHNIDFVLKPQYHHLITWRCISQPRDRMV